MMLRPKQFEIPKNGKLKKSRNNQTKYYEIEPNP
jgi:hypothetical protein